MTMSIIDIVAAYLGHTKEEALHLSRRAPKTYRHYKIAKKKGGLRTIHHPSRQTKALQYALIHTFLNRLPVHPCAVAYRRHMRSPLLKNASLHAPYGYSVRVDFSDFFHSISPRDLFVQIEDNGIQLSKQDQQFIDNCLFINVAAGRKGLAIGAPSSPVVSNVVMHTIDEEIVALAASISPKSVYTRYADDIVFSTDTKGACHTFYEAISEQISRTKSPRLSINAPKTIFGSRASRRVITGLFICPDGGISLGRQNKRYIRKLLFDLSRKRLPADKLAYLSGYLAFTLDVEPDFYNRLSLKYGAELLERALKLQ